MKPKPTVVLGVVGTKLDDGHGPKRWTHWRPTVGLCQQDDLEIARFELLHAPREQSLAQVLTADIRHVSPSTTVRRHELALADPWDFEEVYGALHDFARGYPFETEREDYLVHITTGTHVMQICWFLLVESRDLPARLLQASPGAGRERSLEGTATIIDLDLSKYDRLASRFAQERRAGASFLKDGIATRNAAFNRLMDRIEQVAVASREPILLQGPTGAGKSQLARRIHELKKQKHQLEGPFVDVNCATLRGDAAMSTLFGHVRGAFTGAAADRPGLLRQADGGLLFLDEIGELGLDEQAMLLRAIEEKAFYPLGSDKEVRSGFQLLCGTNRDLAARVREGKFRDDLLARIDLWTFVLPGLRDRPEDIEPNLAFELERLSTRLGVRISFTREARERFLSFATSPGATWPRNFRDFGACLARIATLAPGGRIGAPLVDEEIARLRDAWTRVAAPPVEDAVLHALGPARAATLDPFDRVQLDFVLRTCLDARTLSDAGRVLFANSRLEKSSSNDADRLRKYLARWDLQFRALGAATNDGHARASAGSSLPSAAR